MFLVRVVALFTAAFGAIIAAAVMGGVWGYALAGAVVLAAGGGLLALMGMYFNIVDWPGADEDADLEASGLADGETGRPRHSGSGA